MADRNLRPNFMPFIPAALAASVLVLAAVPASADAGLSVRALLDLSPERVAAFREALRDFTSRGEEAGVDDSLLLVSVHQSPGSWVGSDLDLAPPLGGRDRVAEEEFLMAGREHEYERAMRRWMSRRIKGSDARSESSEALTFRSGWDHGPLLGVTMGNWSASVGPQTWGLRVTKRTLRRGGPWAAIGYLKRDADDDVRVGFLIGRSLLSAHRR